MWLNSAVWCNKMFLRKKKEFCILLTFSFLKHFQDLIILAAVPGLQIRRWCPAYLAIKIHKPPTLRKKGNIYSLLQNIAVIKLIAERFILENQLYNFISSLSGLPALTV